jgi:hypothetical protein
MKSCLVVLLSMRLDGKAIIYVVLDFTKYFRSRLFRKYGLGFERTVTLKSTKAVLTYKSLAVNLTIHV